MGQFGSPRAADPQTARFQPKPMGQPFQGQRPPMGGFKPPGGGGGWDPNGFTNGGLAQIGRAAGGMQQNQWDGTMFGMPMQGGGGGGQGQNLFGRVTTPAPTLYEQGAFGTIPSGGMGRTGGGSFADLMSGFGGYGAPAGGGSQGQPGITAGPGGYNIPGLINQQQPAPQYQAPAPEQFGPGDQGPNQYAGMSGSDIFARLFGQRP
jgi:hypothetical protein